MTAHVKVGGVWRTLDPKMKIGGVWKDAVGGWVKVAGVWRKFYPPYVAPAITLAPRIFDTSAGAHTTASFSNAAGTNLYVVAVATGSGHNTGSVTDSRGGSWTLVQTAVTTSGRIELWARDNTMGDLASMTVTYTPVGTIINGGGLAVLKAVGLSGTPVAAIRQSAFASNIASGVSASVTLPSAALTGNPMLGAVLLSSSGQNPRAGWTELVEDSYTTPNTTVEIMSINGGETASVIQWGNLVTGQKGAIVAEFSAG
jgi:hypothetical protein